MDDLEFVQSFVKGDKQIRSEFLDKYSRLIYNYIRHILSTQIKGFLEEQIEDIFHDFFCNLLEDNCKKLRIFKAKNGCSLASWLRQLSINFTIDYLRKKRASVSLEEENEDGLALKDIVVDNSQPASQGMSISENLVQLKECIGLLDTDEKFFLELHFNRGIDLERLKDFLKLSRGAVDMQKQRLMNKLRECFKNKGFLG